MTVQEVRSLQVGDEVILAPNRPAKVLFIARDLIVMAAQGPTGKDIAFSLTDVAGLRAWTRPREPFDETIPMVIPSSSCTHLRLREIEGGLFHAHYLNNGLAGVGVTFTRAQMQDRLALYQRALAQPQAQPLSTFTPEPDPNKE